jgi:transposase
VNEDIMKCYEVYAGIDVGKSFHYIYAISSSNETLANHRLPQDEVEITDVLTTLLGHGSVLVVVDQPKNIGTLTLSCAHAIGCDTAFLPGLAMRRAAGMLPGDAKTDARDARVIAETAKCFPQALRPIPAKGTVRAALDALVSYDDDLRADRTREINRLRSALMDDHPAFERALGDALTSEYALSLLVEYGGPWGMATAGRDIITTWARNKGLRLTDATISRLLAAVSEMSTAPAGSDVLEDVSIPGHAKRVMELDIARADISSRIETLLADNETYRALLTMGGVGSKTACALICCVDIRCFETADQLCSYAGLAPRTRQSGTSIKGESASRCGNRTLKSALFLSAFASIKCDPVSREYYDKKRAEGKHHNAAVIALARKRAKVMFAIMRSGEPYRVN